MGVIPVNKTINRPKRKLLCPKVDIVFRALFKVGNEDITKALISEIIGEKIKVIDINKDKVQSKIYSEEKLGILDLKAILNNDTICNIEVQLINTKHDIERFLYYWSKEYSRQLKQGEDYKKLKKTIGIWILDYEIDKKEFRGLNRCHTKWRIREDKSPNLILTNKLEISILELPKARRLIEQNPDNKVMQWMMFLDNPNCKEVSSIMVGNKDIRKAMEDLEEISCDYEVRRIAELKEKYILDQRTRDNAIKRQELKILKAEKELKEQNEELEQQKEKIKEQQEEIKEQKEEIKQRQKEIKGREKVLKKKQEEILEHEKQMEKEGKLEIARNMLNENIEIDLIVKITGLSKEEVEEVEKINTNQ